MKKNKIYGGIVWLMSGFALLTYGILGLTQTNIPGVEELVSFVNSANGIYLYLAAFISIFLEGLYFIGSFFPGTSFVLLISIVAQTGGYSQFALVMITIFIGWTLAGLANIIGAKYFSRTFSITTENKEALENNAEMTWFPAFRSNTEVAQITEGHSARKVFLSSTKIKLFASIGAAAYAMIIPLFLDIQSLENEDGFLGLAIIAGINFVIGGSKIYQELKKPAI